MENNNYPFLLCLYNINNADQKNYCIKFKDKICHEKSIYFKIEGNSDHHFGIYIIINNKRYKIQTKFDDSDISLNESLLKLYDLLNKTDEKSENYPLLECFYEKGNDTQKEYCYKIKNALKPEKPISFEIESIESQPFTINFIINNKIYQIQFYLMIQINLYMNH